MARQLDDYCSEYQSHRDVFRAAVRDQHPAADQQERDRCAFGQALHARAPAFHLGPRHDPRLAPLSHRSARARRQPVDAEPLSDPAASWRTVKTHAQQTMPPSAERLALQRRLAERTTPATRLVRPRRTQNDLATTRHRHPAARAMPLVA
jgi:hypothetical protein